MLNIKPHRVVLVAAVASAMVLTACSGPAETPQPATNGAAEELIPIRLVINNTVSSLMAVIAQEQGFFEQNGLDVTSTTVTDISKIPPTLGPQYDIGFGVQPLVIRGASQGLETVVIAGNIYSSEEAPSMELITLPDSGIDSAEDMAGKTLASTTLAGNLHLGTLYWLQENGVDPETVTSVQVATPNMMDQLTQGQVDVIGLQEPYLTLAKEQGMKRVAFPFTAVAPAIFESLWITSPSWAEENEDAITRFRNSLNEAIEWSAANESEAKNILAEFTQQDVDLVQASPLLEYKVEVTPEDLEVWGTAMKAVTDYSGNVDYESLIHP
jgi:NitT/TauT family transport system substrate-binding protein